MTNSREVGIGNLPPPTGVQPRHPQSSIVYRPRSAITVITQAERHRPLDPCRPVIEHLESAPKGRRRSTLRAGRRRVYARDDRGFDAFAPVPGDALDIEYSCAGSIGEPKQLSIVLATPKACAVYNRGVPELKSVKENTR